MSNNKYIGTNSIRDLVKLSKKDSKTRIEKHIQASNPHNITKSDIGLDNVENYKALDVTEEQNLTDEEKQFGRDNLGLDDYISTMFNDLISKMVIEVNSDSNTGTVTIRDAEIYGFNLNQSTSDPNSMISYIGQNTNYTAAHMDYDNDVFDYGDWGNAFFIKNLRPCMLNYDGTEAYLLDPNDYTKTISGEDAYNSDTTVAGNVMVGIPKVYFKLVLQTDDSVNVYISNKQVDTNYHAWAHINNYGDEVPYMYMPAYDGSNVDSVLRSISGLSVANYINATQTAEYAAANNQNGDNIWSMNTYSDWLLIVLLSLLISKTTDSKTAFGRGNNNSYKSTSNTGQIKSGTMDQKGLFWGTTDNVSGVKIFGIENFWGNIWRWMYGLINNKGTQLVKLTYGTEDGSTVEGYNFTGDGYINIGSTPSGTNGGYLKSMTFTENGIFIKEVSGSASTYYTSGAWFNNSQVDVAAFGGDTSVESPVGLVCVDLSGVVSASFWAYGGSPKCLPKKTA
jgi:hypothetical protein